MKYVWQILLFCLICFVVYMMIGIVCLNSIMKTLNIVGQLLKMIRGESIFTVIESDLNDILNYKTNMLYEFCYTLLIYKKNWWRNFSKIFRDFVFLYSIMLISFWLSEPESWLCFGFACVIYAVKYPIYIIYWVD